MLVIVTSSDWKSLRLEVFAHANPGRIQAREKRTEASHTGRCSAHIGRYST